ncbi:hypothetical protein ACVW01_001883 [Thermostichus sp. MS-CIW-19]
MSWDPSRQMQTANVQQIRLPHSSPLPKGEGLGVRDVPLGEGLGVRDGTPYWEYKLRQRSRMAWRLKAKSRQMRRSTRPTGMGRGGFTCRW